MKRCLDGDDGDVGAGEVEACEVGVGGGNEDDLHVADSAKKAKAQQDDSDACTRSSAKLYEGEFLAAVCHVSSLTRTTIDALHELQQAAAWLSSVVKGQDHEQQQQHSETFFR